MNWRNWFSMSRCGRRRPSELEQAIARIDVADDVVDLLVVLLEICRRHAREVLSAGQTRERREAAAQIEDKAALAFTGKGLTDATKELAKTTLIDAANLALAARALALGIDRGVLGRDPKAFVKLCAKGQPCRVLKEGDPYPDPVVRA